MAEKSPSKSGSMVPVQTNLVISESLTECFDEDHVDREENSLLSVKFETLSVSSNSSTSTHKQTLFPEMKSEKEVLKLRKSCKKSKSTFVLKKSKLGESFKTFQSPKSETTANQDYKDETDVFGRKFSLGLEDFESLSILENKQIEVTEEASKYSAETFKNLNVCASKRKRAPTPEGDCQETPALVSCGQQARMYSDVTADELAGYLEDTTFFPKRMSYMAEMMYT